MSRRRNPQPPTLEPSEPLAVCVALTDADAKQRLALLLRDLGASRLGLSDPFGAERITIVEADGE